MKLVETFEQVMPSIVAFISQFRIGRPGSPPPLSPMIFGTGFVVHEDGIVATNRHVVECFEKLPKHPINDTSGLAAILFVTGVNSEGAADIRWLIVDVLRYTTLSQFSSSGPWYGEDIPDVGFVQLKVRKTPPLHLAADEHYIRPGTPIATAGFPMGDLPLTVQGKLNQMTPFVRRGIVSSVYPFSIKHPHGFTIDIMQQSGSSGSPIFYEEEPIVVGMMASGIVEPVTAGDGNLAFQILVPTNISIAVPATAIASSLDSFRTAYPMECSSLPTLQEHIASKPAANQIGWDTFEPA